MLSFAVRNFLSEGNEGKTNETFFHLQDRSSHGFPYQMNRMKLVEKCWIDVLLTQKFKVHESQLDMLESKFANTSRNKYLLLVLPSAQNVICELTSWSACWAGRHVFCLAVSTTKSSSSSKLFILLWKRKQLKVPQSLLSGCSSVTWFTTFLALPRLHNEIKSFAVWLLIDLRIPAD